MILPVEIIPMREAHEGLVYTSWINSLGAEAPWHRLDRNWYNSAAHALIEQLLGARTVVCLVATEPGDPDQAYGYLVGEPDRRVLHWIFTKGPFRRMRVAARLMETAFEANGELIDTTVDTPRLRYLKRWQLNPRSYRLCEAVR